METEREWLWSDLFLLNRNVRTAKYQQEIQQDLLTSRALSRREVICQPHERNFAFTRALAARARVNNLSYCSFVARHSTAYLFMFAIEIRVKVKRISLHKTHLKIIYH